MKHLDNLIVGTKILYDRFPGIDEPLPGVVDGFGNLSGDKIHIWVNCNGKRFIAPESKLIIVKEEGV